MLEQLVKVWKTNHGNWLFALGVAAAALMSVIWYFQLLPDVQLVPGDQPTRIPRNPVNLFSPVLIVVSGPARTSDRDPSLHGSVLVYPSEGELLESATPIQIHPFELDRAGFDFVTISYSNSESFAVVAYLDLNGNGRLDFDSAGVPSEPLRTSRNQRTLPTTLSLESAAVSTSQSEPLELHFQFSRSRVENDTLQAAARERGATSD